jgi:hypothetical protein
MKKASQYHGNRRLLKLAAHLEELPRERFDYGVYVGKDWKGAPDLSCGTTACAIGWACAMPEFRKMGLRILRSESRFSPGFYVPRGGSHREAPSAGTAIFSLTETEWDYLFMPEQPLYDHNGDELRSEGPPSEATAKQVARHIRRFVAWREKRRTKR